MPSRRAHFLDLGPAHVSAFPSCRQYREKSVARIVACKVHHVKIAQARNSLGSVIRIRQAQFTPNLVHHETVDTPVEAILRSRFAHHHYRLERINRRTLQHNAVVQGIFRNRNARKRIRQVSPENARNKRIPKVARSVGTLRTHATAIHKTACTGMRNHERTPSIRILGKRNIERGILGTMSLHHDIVHKANVIASAGGIVLGRLFALEPLRAIVINHLLVKRINRGDNAILDEKLAIAGRLIVGVCKAQVFFPVMDTLAAPRRVQIVRCRIGIEKARTRRKRVILGFFLELYAQHKDFERVNGMRQRRQRENP